MNSLKVPLIVGLVASVVVIAVGLYATNFTVYLGNDPTTCNNCHVMDAAYEGWFHAGHQQWATCVDCHTPHATIPKYLYKAKSGMNHVTMFTLGHIPEPLRAASDTKRIVQANCLRCHSETVAEVADGQMDAGRNCSECHRSVAHGPRGISILPHQDKGMYTPPQSNEEK
jgi:cytochrome c nitrite reductase small subunit